MTIHFDAIPADVTLYIPFSTYGGTNGESITLTGLAVTDIEIYKNGGTTQRSSDSGLVLLDADGIDFDGITGIHGFSIDLSDDTDTGFYSVGGFYWVVVSSITVDSQTVNFVAATFRVVTVEAITGQPVVDVGALSGDAAAADNLESMYDGTGYTDQTGPSSRSQVDGIGASSGGSLNFAIDTDNVLADIKSISFVGVQTTNTFTATEAEDGTLHVIDDTANAIDIVYGTSIGGGRTATEAVFKGYLSSANDTLNIMAYDFIGADWETRGTLSGQGGSGNVTQTVTLLSKHTGTGSDLGKVYIRFQNTGQTNPTLNVDELLVEAVNIGQSVGYANGSVWVDTNNGVAGTESFVNGVADNPTNLIASAKTIATNVGISDFHIVNGSTVTLAEDTSNESYFGDNWTLALAGQTVTGAHFQGANVSGIQVGACEFFDCEVGAVTTIDGTLFQMSRLEGTITLPVGTVYLSNSEHAGTPVLDFGAAVGNTTVHIHKYGGGIEFQNFGDNGTDIVHLDGQGKLTINANSSGGTINLRGNWEIENNAGGVTINYDDQSTGYAGGQIWVDTVNGTAGTNAHINGTSENAVLTWADALTLSSALGLTDFHAINGSTITLSATSDNYSLFGDNWVLALGGQSVAGMYVQGATVSGIGTSSSEVHFEGCDIGTASVQKGHFDFCGFSGTLTQTLTGDYEYHNCYDKGSATAVFTKTAGQTITMEFVNWSGHITISGLESGDTLIIGGSEIGDITLNGADADVDVHGIYHSVTDNRTGSPTLSISGALIGGDVAAILVDTGTTIPTTLGTPAGTDLATDIAAIDTEIGVAGAGLTDLGGMSTGMKAEVESEANDALVVQKLDHLVAVADGDDPVDGSIMAHLVSATEDWSTFVPSTDSLEAIKDHIGNGTNLTEAGGTGDHLSAIPWNSSWDTEVQSECNDALVALGLDHLVSASVAGADITDDSIIAFLVSKESTADWDDFANTTDSLQAISDSAVSTADILASGDVDGYTLEETLKLCLSALAGKLSGAATTTIVIRAGDDSKARITATVDSDGNRTAVTLDETG